MAKMEEPMDATLDTRIEIIPLSKHIGAEVREVDLRQPLDVATSKAIYKARLDHAVLVFRGLTIEQEDLLRITEIFGEIGGLARPPKFFPKGYSRLLPNIMMISNIRENGETIGAPPDGKMNFHHDMLHAEIPHNGNAALFDRSTDLWWRDAVCERYCGL
jgi:taurine dioxygenase